VCWQLPLLQVTPLLLVVSHTLPQAPQLLGDVAIDVSQPLVSGAAMLQFA
jgi:hypothetical protein